MGLTLTIRVTAREKDSLELIAAENECLWGEKGNISLLLRAIASKQLMVVSSEAKHREEMLALQAMSNIQAGLNQMKSIFSSATENAPDLVEELIMTLGQIPNQPTSWNSKTKGAVWHGLQDALRIANELRRRLNTEL